VNDLFRFLDLLRARWFTVMATTTVMSSLAVGYLLVAPRWYESTLTVMPAGDDRGGLLGAASALAGDMGLAFGVGAGPDADKIDKVLNSRSVADAVIVHFDLVARYPSLLGGETYIEDTREELADHCTTKVDRKSGTVALTCEDQDPAVAHAMTVYMGDVANETFRRITAGAAGEQRRFLENRLVEVRRDLDVASRHLRAFQEQHKLVNLDAQSEAVVAQMATLKADVIAKQMQLGYLRTFAAPEEDTAVRLRQQIAVTEKKLRALEEGHRGGRDRAGAAAADIFPAVNDVPALRFELEQLLRAQKIQETLFMLLTQQFETAKLGELRNTSQFNVLDAPVVATRPARPRLAVTLGGAFALGVLLGISWALVRERRRVAA
jgi:uncharacterized protein involved in exopolysaccharide biosynthesis